MFPSVPPPPPPPPEEVGKEEGAVETAMKEEAPSEAPSAAAGSGDDHAQAGRQTEDSTAKVLQEAFARGAPRCFFRMLHCGVHRHAQTVQLSDSAIALFTATLKHVF